MKNKKLKLQYSPAFTVIECLVCIVIISIITIISISSYSGFKTKSEITNLNSNMQAIRNAFDVYHSDWNVYPNPMYSNDKVNSAWFPGQSNSNTTGLLSPSLFYPVNYVSVSTLNNPLGRGSRFAANGNQIHYLNEELYRRIAIDAGFPEARLEGIKRHFHYFRDNVDTYMLIAVGPSKRFRYADVPLSQFTPYDPTNGVHSFGNFMISKSQNYFSN